MHSTSNHYEIRFLRRKLALTKERLGFPTSPWIHRTHIWTTNKIYTCTHEWIWTVYSKYLPSTEHVRTADCNNELNWSDWDLRIPLVSQHDGLAFFLGHQNTFTPEGGYSGEKVHPTYISHETQWTEKVMNENKQSPWWRQPARSKDKYKFFLLGWETIITVVVALS